MKTANHLNEIEAPEPAIERTDRDQAILPPEGDISLLDVAIVLARHRGRILWTVLITTVIGVVLAFVLPVRYTATTSLLPPQQNSSIGSTLLSQLGTLGALAGATGTSGFGLKNPNELQVALLKSRTVEDAVVDRFHLAELYHKKKMSDVRKKLEKVIDIETSTKDPLIRVSATDGDPQRATDLANGYVEEFKKFSATLAVTEASQRRVFFENQLLDAKNNLANAEEELKKTEEKTGLIELSTQARAAIQSAATLRAEVAAKEVEIRAIRSFATGENSQLHIAEEELAGLRAQMAKMGAAAGGAAPSLPNGAMQQEGLEYVRKMRDVRYYETIFELLARQLEAAKVDEARQGVMIQVVDKAIEPDRHSSPKRTLIVLGSVVLGFLIGIGWAFATEAIRRISANPAERPRLDTLREEFSSKQSDRGQTGIV